VLGDDGWLTGTITSTLNAFKKPIAREGEVTAIEREPHWMPVCTHVLQLHDAAIQQGGRPGRLLLFLTVEDAQLIRVEGFANRTTQARPVINAEQLALTDGRLSGVFQVQYRADEWAQPLTEQGYTAAAEYEIDAKLAGSGKSGSYKGLFGVRWTRTAPLGEPK